MVLVEGIKVLVKWVVDLNGALETFLFCVLLTTLGKVVDGADVEKMVEKMVEEMVVDIVVDIVEEILEEIVDDVLA